MLLLLADEHIPTISVRILENAGHDIASVAADFQSTDDVDIIAIANREGRIVVTCDSDFGELILNTAFNAIQALFIFV